MALAPIVVGYDSSSSADTALDWAVAEAGARNRPLRILHVLPDLSVTSSGYGIYSAPDPEAIAKIGEQQLAAAKQRVQHAAPDLVVTTQLLHGMPAAGILGQLADAELAVVGNRGQSSFTELLLGATGISVATHAHCPVIVTRPSIKAREPGTEAHRVVVGVDGSAASSDALAFAFEEASLRGLGLTAVYAWAAAFYNVPGRGGPLSRNLVEEFEGDDLRLLAENLAGWQEKYPDVSVRRVIMHREAVEALVLASTDAELLIVGSRGRGGVLSALLGSVSHGVLHHARCPVAVVRPSTKS